MPKDAEFRRNQREAYEAVLKALSVVKLDWSKRKLLTELRKHLNISQSTYVELLEKVLNDPEVKSSKSIPRVGCRAGSLWGYRGETDVGGSLREVLNEAGGAARPAPRNVTYESENETDTEGDEDYRKDEDLDEEDSYSEGSTSRPHRADHRRHNRAKGRTRKRPQPTARRRTKHKGRLTPQDSVGSGSRNDLNPLSRDEVFQYEMSHPNVTPVMTGFDLQQTKPPYDKDVFESYLLNGALEELRDMHRQIKRRRHALINVMLEDDDPSTYPEDDLVQKILLREKNIRQEKALEHELSVLNKQG